ncbi:22169_t:CDS:1, partial [Gigaspora rosea]
NLHMKTLRAIKIRMLFEKNGVGKLENVINNVTSAEPLLEAITNRGGQSISALLEKEIVIGNE